MHLDVTANTGRARGGSFARTRAARALPWAALAGLVLLTRSPVLLNASALHSDAAVVGLQARHMLRGEWAPYLWGSGYQTSADSTLAAAFFAVFGATPIALVLSALSAYVALVLLVFATLRRHLGQMGAFVATLPLVFTTACVDTYAVSPPRQLALTVAFAAVFFLDGARRAARPRAWLATGGFAVLFAWLCNPYAMTFLPALGALAALAAITPREGARASASRLGAVALGAGAAALPLAWLWTRPEARHGVTSMTTRLLAHNARLFWHECLPWAIGTKVYRPLHAMDYAPWRPPPAVHALQVGGVLLLVGLLAYGAALSARRRTPAALRRLGLFAVTTIVLTLAAFQVSMMVMDEFSMRYLAAVVLCLPFALAPVVARLGARRSLALLSPYLFVAFVSGWVSHGPAVRGALPVRWEAGRGVDAARLATALEARGVRYGVADYWASYRVTFLTRERVVLVPLHARQDRYAPYRDALDRAGRIAYVHDSLRSLEDDVQTERELVQAGYVAEGPTIVAGPFHAVVLRRAGGSGAGRAFR